MPAMTIRGNGEGIIIFESPRDVPPTCSMGLPEIDGTIDQLFVRLESDEVDYDTATGLIEFPFSNNQSDLLGNTTMTRIFRDWVFLRLKETVDVDEISNVFDTVFNGLQQRTIQSLEQ